MIKNTIGSKLLTAGIVYEKHSASYRRLILLNAFLYITVFVLTFFAFYNLVKLNNYLIGIIDILAALNACYALYYLHKFKVLERAINLGMINLFIFFLTFVYINQNHDLGLIWTIFFPLFAILLKGRKNGALLATLFYTILFYFAYDGIGVWQDGAWSLASFLRLFFASVVLTYIVYFMEYSQEIAEENLAGIREKEAESMAKLKQLSIKDPLTGLYNRRHFHEIFERQFQISHRHNFYFALFILDIDFFKQYNDTYGHQKGDEALCLVADCLKRHMRRSDDFIFRLGGEEFSGICISENKAKIREQISSLCTLIESLNIEHKGSDISEYLSASIGVKLISEYDDYNFDRLYKEADDALYQAKRDKRNCVVFT